MCKYNKEDHLVLAAKYEEAIERINYLLKDNSALYLDKSRLRFENHIKEQLLETQNV